MNNTDELVNRYVALCGTKATMEDAPNLPTRYKAVLDYQGDLSAFVLKFPEVIQRGVEALVDDEVARRNQAEYAHVERVLKAFGVKRHG